MSLTQSHPTRELEKLRETGLALAYDAQDIRGRKVNDPNGDAVGHVSNLFIDVGERKVRMLEIRGGGFLGIGDRHVLVPVVRLPGISQMLHCPRGMPALGESWYWKSLKRS